MSALHPKAACAVQLGMSALGQKQTCAAQTGMSALPPKADMCSALTHVRLGPKADIRWFLDPNIILGRPIPAFMARIEYAARFYQQQFDLVLGISFVFHALRHDEHFASGHLHCAITEIDPQSTV